MTPAQRIPGRSSEKTCYILMGATRRQSEEKRGGLEIRRSEPFIGHVLKCVGATCSTISIKGACVSRESTMKRKEGKGIELPPHEIGPEEKRGGKAKKQIRGVVREKFRGNTTKSGRIRIPFLRLLGTNDKDFGGHHVSSRGIVSPG